MPNMEVRYCPDLELKVKVKELKAVLQPVEGKMRWVVTEEDGFTYALRPESAREA